jgi:hypothetical protein
MVSSYEKYCDECAKTHAQDTTFWKRAGAYDVLCSEEKIQDAISIDRAAKGLGKIKEAQE